MKRLIIRIEQNGIWKKAGEIVGNHSKGAVFRYTEEWLADSDRAPLSVSLPLQQESFSPEATRIFFEGLLPEGFTRRSVATWLRADEDDYLAILSGLGKECLGAVQILDENDPEPETAGYEQLTLEDVKRLADEGAVKSAQMVVASHLSLAGASGKVGLYYEGSSGNWYQPKGMAASTHIVKQSHVRLKNLVANEQIVLKTAEHLDIPTPESKIIQTDDPSEESVLLATKRYDRIFRDGCRMTDSLPVPFRLHQEDFAQALGIASSGKYEKPGQQYLKRCFELLRRVSANPLEDQRKLLDLLIFDSLIGNTDNHIKNLSLLYSEDLQTVRLAPFYDLTCTLVYPEHTREMSIGIAGTFQWNEINRKTFEDASGEIGIGRAIIRREYDRIRSGLSEALKESAEELAKEGISNAERTYESIRKAIGI